MRGAALLSCALLLVACSDEGLRRACQTDAECGLNKRCDRASGTCVCASDLACASGEFCNGTSCQRRVGCDTSLDCPPNLFCDRTTGNCLERKSCTTDVQCALGEVCDTLRYRCVPGCRETGDCRLGDVCRCEGSEESCTIGVCETGPCDDDSFCRYGERCLDDGTGEKRCVVDERGPYCQGCTIQPGVASRCPGDDPNFCLLDRKVNYARTYCGVDCNAGQPCPWGYECRNILVLTSALCRVDTDCPANGASCASDDDCPGARCNTTVGRCGGKCSYNEDSQSGFCTCSADSECPTDTCNDVDWKCRITRRPCTPEGGECERAIYCVNLGDRAACLIGKNCVPGEGLKCEDVRPGAAAP